MELIRKTILLLIFSSFMSVGWGQDCDEGYTEIDGECYYQSDLDVLQIFIDNSLETINMEMDVDSSGVIEPLELGEQEWVDGRIINLNCHWYSNDYWNNCGISGMIPSVIENLTNLTHLYLSYNQIKGEIPSEMGNLTNLRWLDLMYNELTGEIPPEIGNLTNLTELRLYSNQLTGEIPSEIGNLTNLTRLWLRSNQLIGEIPSEIGNLTNLIELTINLNQLTGEIPSDIGSLTNLTRLWLSSNQLTGEIPSEIGNLTNLNYLSLNSNKLTGEIPSDIGNLTNLDILSLNNNQLTGNIPESICDLTNLTWSSDFIYWKDSHIYGNNICQPYSDYPECLINQEPFTDENENGIWDEGEPFEDTNENGIYEEDYVGEQDTTNCSTMSITDNLTPILYSLSSPYPNPFNPTTTISFSIPQLDMVSLNVYDITGKLVTTLINEQLNIGYHSIDWDGTNQSSGMYLVRMESGEYVETQKLLLVK